MPQLQPQTNPVDPQLTLLPPDASQDAAVLARCKALELYMHSPVLRGRYSSFEVLMANPVTGRSVRMAADALVRSALKRTRGR